VWLSGRVIDHILRHRLISGSVLVAHLRGIVEATGGHRALSLRVGNGVWVGLRHHRQTSLPLITAIEEECGHESTDGYHYHQRSDSQQYCPYKTGSFGELLLMLSEGCVVFGHESTDTSGDHQKYAEEYETYGRLTCDDGWDEFGRSRTV